MFALVNMEKLLVDCSFCDNTGSTESVLQVLNGVHMCDLCVEKEEPATASATPCSVCRKCQYHVRRPKHPSDLAVCEQCIAKLFKERVKRSEAVVPHCSFCQKLSSLDKLITSTPGGGAPVHICRDCVARFADKGA